MSDELEKYEKAEMDFARGGFQQINIMLNKQPSKKILKENNAIPYIPISIIEKQLDEVFNGMWSYTIDKAYRELNSLVVIITLKVVLPNGFMITRGGIGCVPVELRKDEKVLTEETLNKMALQKNFPSAKSFALSNAAQSLGEYFGRNLNRKEQDLSYVYLDEQMEQYNPTLELAKELLKTSKIEDKNFTLQQIQRASLEKLNTIIDYLKKQQ